MLVPICISYCNRVNGFVFLIKNSGLKDWIFICYKGSPITLKVSKNKVKQFQETEENSSRNRVNIYNSRGAQIGQSHKMRFRGNNKKENEMFLKGGSGRNVRARGKWNITHPARVVAGRITRSRCQEKSFWCDFVALEASLLTIIRYCKSNGYLVMFVLPWTAYFTFYIICCNTNWTLKSSCFTLTSYRWKLLWCNLF